MLTRRAALQSAACALPLPGLLASRALAEAAIETDLVLAADVSQSMMPVERQAQRAAYMAALGSPGVINAIRSTPQQKIRLTYFEWGGALDQFLIAGPSIIDGPPALLAFLQRLRDAPDRTGELTAIGSAMAYGATLFAPGSLRKVMDVSGDGANNDGIEPVGLDLGDVIVNGLPMGDEALTQHYRAAVVRGGFCLPFNGKAMPLARAIAIKIASEIAGLVPKGAVA